MGLPVSASDPDPLSATPDWTASGEFLQTFFGVSVSTAGDVNGDGYSDVIVGAYQFSSNKGKVYVFRGSSGGLLGSASWTATGATSDDRLGYSVSTAGDVNGDGFGDVVVGTPFVNGGLGKVYVYYGSAAGLPAGASWTVDGTATDRTGSSVAGAGDVNNDGYSDLLVGHGGPTSTAGKSYVYLGGPGGLASTPVWTVSGENPGDEFGSSVQTAGDVNGDGYSDVMIGAYAYFGITGKAYVYLGTATGLEPTPVWTASGPTGQGQTFYADTVSTAGDLDGDGFADVMTGSSNLRTVYIYQGSLAGPDPIATWTLTSADGSFGSEVAAAGDVNGDGYADLLVGAPLNGSFAGRAHLFLGQSGGPATTPAWIDDGVSNDRFGHSIAPAGDVNDDGASDVIIGAFGALFGGKAYAYHGALATCLAQAQEVAVVSVSLDGNGKPVLHFQDSTPPACVTGYNVYRAAARTGPWILIDSNVTDMDVGLADIQYVDPSGDLGDLWYYEIATWDGNCSVEGPY